MLAHETAVGTIETAREVLDRFSVAGRLRHIGEYIWRGGTLRLEAEDHGDAPSSVWYALRAQWPAPIFERLPSPDQALARGQAPVMEGRWIRASAGYVLKIGLDLDVPSAIFIRTERPLSNVPFIGRPPSVVEHALSADLTTYVEWFLDHLAPVPQATQMAARRLAQAGLEATPSRSS